MEPLLLRALANLPVDRPPVWLMRQAGRYLTEYQEMKSKHRFLELCKSSELALEVSLQPVRALDVDAAILFSDILIPVEPMGIQLQFNPGPQIINPISCQADVEALRVPDPWKHVSFVFQTVRALKTALSRSFESGKQMNSLTNKQGDDSVLPGAQKALIGFAGAPWTLACYLIEQGPWKHMQGSQIFAKEHRKAMHLLLEKLSLVVGQYLFGQIESGADVVQIFDTWAGNLNASDYREFSLPYIQKIVEQIRGTKCPIILYATGFHYLLEEMAKSGVDCLSLDWRIDLKEARSRLGTNIALQGNLDPTHLFGTEEDVVAETRQMIAFASGQSGYIVNLGHGVLPKTPRQNVIAFVNAVKTAAQ